MGWGGGWGERGCIRATAGSKGQKNDVKNTTNKGKAALLDGACVGEVDGVTKGVFGPQQLPQGEQMTYITQQTKVKQHC